MEEDKEIDKPLVEDSFKKKRGPRSKEVTFARPPFAAEVFTKDNAQKFDELPGWGRHFIKQFTLTGNIALAAKQANISKELEDSVNVKSAGQESVKDLLANHGLGPSDIVTYLHDCVKADTVIRDKHGEVHHTTDLKVRLQAIDMILRLTGELGSKKVEDKKGNAMELFQGMDPEGD